VEEIINNIGEASDNKLAFSRPRPNSHPLSQGKFLVKDKLIQRRLIYQKQYLTIIQDRGCAICCHNCLPPDREEKYINQLLGHMYLVNPLPPSLQDHPKLYEKLMKNCDNRNHH
jgi:hypothetical protein